MRSPVQNRPTLPLVLLGISLTYILVLGRVVQIIPAAALIANLFLILFLAGWLWLIKRAGSEIAASPLDLGLFILLVALLVSSATSLDPSRSWRMAWPWLASGVVFYAALAFMRTGVNNRQLAGLSLLILLPFVIFGYAELLRWVTALPPAEQSLAALGRAPRLTGLTGSSNILGTLMAVGILLALGLSRVSRSARIISLSWIVLAGPILLLSRSRGGFLAAFSGLMVMTLVFTWIRFRREKVWGLVLKVTAGLLLAGGIGTYVLLQLRPAGLGGETTSIRLVLWQTAIDNWQTSPIWGTGLDTESSANLIRNHPVPVTFPLRFAHSLFFSVLSGTGLAGAFALLFIGGQTSVWLVQKLRRNEWSAAAVGLLGALVALFAQGLIDTPEPWIICLNGVFLAGLVAELQPIPAGKQLGRRLHLIWVPVALGLFLIGLHSYTVSRHYERGLAALSETGEEDWETAAVSFDQAVDHLLFKDSGALLAAGLAHGTLAAEDSTHLDPAIDRFEILISQEPGWPGNHANLSWLYQQAGRPEDARGAMRRAVEISPQSPLFQLNLALLLEQQGLDEEAAAVWAETYALPQTWHNASLWANALAPQTSPFSQEAASPAEEIRLQAWDALAAGDPPAAGHLIETLPEGQDWLIGRGLVALLNGDDAAARGFFDQDRQATRSLDPYLWQNWIDLADLPAAEQRAWTIDEIGHQTVLGIGSAGLTIYPFDLLSRSGLPVDMLPHMVCFASTDGLDRNLAVLRVWYKQRGVDGKGEWIDSFRSGRDGRGLIPCTGAE